MRSKSARSDVSLPLKPAVFLLLVSLAAGEKHGYALRKDVADSQRR